ncbi:O-antigen polymerase [Capnocytophaga cynodegmi]|uniref:O-antigen polymerase n=1 Tax=Capnocytophaga cynodegmi TaxID=28189 RepID=UPI0037CF0C3D
MNNSKNIILCAGIFFLLLCLFQEGNMAYENIFLLPLSFIIVSQIYFKTYDLLRNSFVFNVFIIQAILRYFIIPYKVATGGQMTGGNSEYGETAILIMIFEIFFCFTVFQFISSKQRYAYVNRSQEIKPLEGSITLYLLIVILALYIFSTGYFSKVNPIWNMGQYVEKVRAGEGAEDTGFGGILFRPFKLIIAIFCTSLIYKSKRINPERKKYYYLIVIFATSLFIVGTSRLSILHFATPLLVMVTLMISKKSSRKLIIAFISFIIPVILITSIGKFSREDKQASTDSFFTPSSLNAYFAGPGNVAIGIEAYEGLKIKDKPLFFINDLLQNFPGLAKYSSDSYKTNMFFNEKIYGHKLYQDQIVPLSTSGIFHFGYWGSFIYAPIFLLVALYMERKSYKETFLGYKFVYIAVSFSLSMVFMLNIGSLYSSIVSSFLFIYIPFFVINNIKKFTNS